MRRAGRGAQALADSSEPKEARIAPDATQKRGARTKRHISRGTGKSSLCEPRNAQAWHHVNKELNRSQRLSADKSLEPAEAMISIPLAEPGG